MQTDAFELDDSHNGAALFFQQAARPELRDRPRLMIPRPDGSYAPVTWGELSLRVQRLASFLIDRQVDGDARVAVLSQTRLEWGIAALSVIASRAALVPVYPTSTADQLAHVVGHSESRALVLESAEHLRRVLAVWDRLALHTVVLIEPADVRAIAREAGRDPEQIAAVVFSLEQAETLGASSLEHAPERVLERTATIRLDDPAYLVYTSGTTGLPKGVPLSHRNVGASGSDWMTANGDLVREGDVDLLWLPMSHLYGLGEFFLGNRVGFVSYLCEPLQVVQRLPEVRPHVLMAVPAYWEKLAQLARASTAADANALQKITGGRLRFCLSGGAGLAREVKELFRAAGLMIIEGYGLTECSPNLTMNRVDDFDFDSVGKPLPGVRIKIADDGEILAKGANVFSGYFKDPEATAAIFDDDGWLHTGDLGRFNERGFLQIIGRKKEIIVTSGGKNIAPANIELQFKDYPLIATLMVYGDGRKYLTALVDVNDAVAGEMLRAADIAVDQPVREHVQVRRWIEQRVEEVNARLASFETIKRFIISPEPLTVEAGFLTPTLKIRRPRVCERFGALLDALYDAPR